MPLTLAYRLTTGGGSLVAFICAVVARRLLSGVGHGHVKAGRTGFTGITGVTRCTHTLASWAVVGDCWVRMAIASTEEAFAGERTSTFRG